MNGIAFDKPIPSVNACEGAQGYACLRTFDLWWAAFASTLIPVSLIWDFSWESTIGIDRFWSPPHLAMHFGVGLAGLLGLRLLFVFTRARRCGSRASGVNIGPLCGPSGAWVLVWGAGVMLTATFFDNWWQKAYGLGAGLWHPPQLLKTVGFFTLLLGGLMLCVSARMSEAIPRRTAELLCVWHAGLLLAMCSVVMAIKLYPNWQHTSSFYLVSCAIYPVVLLVTSAVTQERWAVTKAALAYLIVVCAMVWLLPLFPARPLTAPIHNPTDHMMPPPFPLLLVVPALIMDLLLMRLSTRDENRGPRAPWHVSGILCGVVFVSVFIPTQWFFSKFLLSASADNWFFAGGGRHWPFFLKIDEARVMFWGLKQDPLTWRNAVLAVGIAIVSAGIGLRVGAWLNRLRR